MSVFDNPRSQASGFNAPAPKTEVADNANAQASITETSITETSITETSITEASITEALNTKTSITGAQTAGVCEVGGKTEVFETVESGVRAYCRSFPAVFARAKGSVLYSESGAEYIDFLAGAGALNYGHNHPVINNAVIEHLASDHIVHGLDLYTCHKREFIQTFRDAILKPRNLRYRLQFCGSTGTNAVEAALKLARKKTGRAGIFSFMGGFHGVSMGSLAVTASKYHRNAGFPLAGNTFMPFPGGTMRSIDTIDYIETVIGDPNSGIETPAAIIVETVQAEGGVLVAPAPWLRALRALCDRHGILLIVDDIQVGCYRTGPFFSFERAGIVPDMVVLSKSLGGCGFPISLLLLRDELDIWKPGEHNGTFRGNQIAFKAATAALKLAGDLRMPAQVEHKGAIIERFLREEIAPLHPVADIRGIGMIWGIDCGEKSAHHTRKVADICFENGLVIERVGRNDTVLKILPALTIDEGLLEKGLDILKTSLKVAGH